MTTPNLPPLPEPIGSAEIRTAEYFDYEGKQVGYTTEEVDAFTAEQMNAYALEALRLASPQGWKLVPETLTDAMIAAADRTVGSYDDQEGDALRRMWRNMLAAAPEATKGNGG